MTWERSPRLFRLILAVLLTLTLSFGVATQQAEPVGATSYGIDISACSWAANFCEVRFCSWSGGTATLQWWTTTQGYSGYQTTYKSVFNGCYIYASAYIQGITRADILIIYCPANCDNFSVYVRW